MTYSIFFIFFVGALGSLRTATAGLGSLIFTGAFSLSISMEKPKISGLPFYIAAFFYCISYIITKKSLRIDSAISDDTDNGGVRNMEESLNLLDHSFLSSDKPYKYGIFSDMNPPVDCDIRASAIYVGEKTNVVMHTNAETVTLGILPI